MTLAFSTEIDNKPTYFVEKIWQSFPDEVASEGNFFNSGEMYKHYNFNQDAYGMYSKLHTIRQDKNDFWKAGNDIHFVIHNRTKNRFQFAPVIKCVSVQSFEIKYFIKNNAKKLSVKVDGKKVNIHDLAENDGFNSAGEFLDYFNKDFTGKIIHWTDFKY